MTRPCRSELGQFRNRVLPDLPGAHPLQAASPDCSQEHSYGWCPPNGRLIPARERKDLLLIAPLSRSPISPSVPELGDLCVCWSSLHWLNQVRIISDRHASARSTAGLAASSNAQRVRVREELERPRLRPAVLRTGRRPEMNKCRSETWIKCPRSDTHLSYMIGIAFITEFSLAADGAS